MAAALAGAMALQSGAAFAQEKTLKVLLFGMPSTIGLQALAGDFEKETGIKADIEIIGQDVFENRITLSFAGRTGDIDVVHTPAIQVQRWVEAGWINPITDQVDALEDKDDFLKGPLEAYAVEGDTYALPFFAEVGLLAYRKDILEAKGQQPPKTWDEMLSVAAAINTPETAAIALRAAPGQGFNMFVFPALMWAYGGKFFADYPSDLTPAINSPENLKALQVYIELLTKYGPQGVGRFNFPEIVAAVQGGQVAMTVDGTSITSQLVDKEKSPVADNIELALPPSGPAGRFPPIAVHGLAVPSDAKDPEASFKFIQWATSKETMAKIALNQAYPDFTRASVASIPEVVEKYSGIQPNFLDLRVEALNEARGDYRPLISTWPEIGAALGENINGALNGLVTPEAALEKADQEVSDIIDSQ
ncbi:sugar ABC transporter substrate-binding protein [Tianweitania sp. BSSL-BM11]|uniref:Sugar ABC transporter substrate-binding protein n=2 Tax=Tianweitania aestuarii TaxID=2814886 RepID=A0ABS5RSZ2_9HYPH|nr:sugar ABC transporter substrate-binding protein [Tianweitania aestuarii]